MFFCKPDKFPQHKYRETSELTFVVQNKNNTIKKENGSRYAPLNWAKMGLANYQSGQFLHLKHDCGLLLSASQVVKDQRIALTSISYSLWKCCVCWGIYQEKRKYKNDICALLCTTMPLWNLCCSFIGVRNPNFSSHGCLKHYFNLYLKHNVLAAVSLRLPVSQTPIDLICQHCGGF